MKKLLIFVVLVGLVGAVRATTYTFTPTPSDLSDLAHANYYTWGIGNFSIPTNEVITEAVLTFDDINNWSAAEDTAWVAVYEGRGRCRHATGEYTEVKKNWLHSWLLDSACQDNAPHGKVKTYNDTDNGTDYFASWSPTHGASANIGTYTDDHGGDHGDVIDLTYTFSTLGLLDELAAYIDNGNNFALGFDPDCHYYNNGVTFVITTRTRSVPDGGTTLLLLGISLFALPVFKRLRRS